MADESPRAPQEDLVVAPDHSAVAPDPLENAQLAGGAEASRVEEPDPNAAGFDASPESSALPYAGASYRLLALVTVLSAASDLVTKWWAKARLSGFEPRGGGAKHVTVIPNHLDFIYAQNPGGAWSFLRGLPEYIRRPFFLFISAAAIVFIVSIYRRVRPDQTAMKWGLPLALGGAIGNLVDRIRYGYVIDFIDVYVTRGQNEHHWPTFNVADIWICVGVALMAFDMFAASRRARAQELALRAAETVPGEPPA